MRVAACRSEALTFKTTADNTIPPPAEVLSPTSRPAHRDTRDPAVPHARPPPPPQVPCAAQALSSQGTEEAEKGRLGKSARRVIPVSPPARLCCNPFLPAHRKRPAPTPRQRLARGQERPACPRLFPESSRCSRRRGGGGVPKLSHQPRSHFPGCRLGTLPPRHLRPLTRAADARRPAATAGQIGVYLPGKFPASDAVPTPGGRASGRGGLSARRWRRRRRRLLRRLPSPAPAAATAEAALGPVPPPRSAHTGTSLAARVPALARVPEGTFLLRARWGCASRAPPA